MAATAASYDRLQELKDFDDSKVGVKGLSDSGITSIPMFFVHPPAVLSDLKSTAAAAAASIPVIDLSPAISGDATARLAVVRQVHDAASTWGFFQVTNHGVPPRVLDETLLAVRSFHDQPPEEKAKHYARDERGGVMYGINNDLYRSKAASWHDYLQVWMAPDPAPEDRIPAICRREAVAWDGHATAVGELVLELLGEGLGLAAGKLKELTFSGTRLWVGTCYPYCPEPDRTLGLKGHTDPGVVTVLLTTRPGLQVKFGEEWVDVKTVPGGLIINVGDLLQIASNGIYQSVQHRVVANSEKEPKISVVMFLNVAEWKGSGYYGPLPEIVTPERPAIYRDITKEEYHENFYSKELDSKSVIEKIKL